jgi:dephospho-CoA kinase
MKKLAAKRITTFKIGITGNICTGKTLIRNALQRYGVNTLDAEESVMQMLADNPYRLAIRLTEHFGSEIIDSRGRFSRKKLAAILYTDSEKKAMFDEKLNPVIREEIKRFLYGPMGSHIRAVESPMLLEMDTRHLFDEIWVVTTRPDVQIKRLMTRDQLSEAEANNLIGSQWSQEKKIAMSDRVIDNSGEINQTESQVRKILDEVKHRVYKVGL